MHATLLANNSQHCWISQCASVCTPCCRLFRVVGSCCAKFETSQTFKPTTPQHSYFFCDRWSIVQQCWIRLHSLPTLLGTRTCITHGLQSLMGCILPMMHCRSEHFWELLQPFAQCWELLHLFALSWKHITEHSKTSKWVLKLQFLTLRQDHKDPFTFMSETHLNLPSPTPPPLTQHF